MVSLEEVLNDVNHSREKRSYFANFILKNPEMLPDLIRVCGEVDNEISCKASWGLEYLSKNRLEAILPYIDQLITIAPKVHQHPAVRPMAKIFEYLILAYYKKKSVEVRKYVTHQHREKIIEICFDWLITNQKVAPKAYSITSLYLLGTEFNWVHDELKITLEKNYGSSSAAYKARSRMILKKLN